MKKRRAASVSGAAAGGAIAGAGIGKIAGAARARHLAVERADGAGRGRRTFAYSEAVKSLRKRPRSKAFPRRNLVSRQSAGSKHVRPLVKAELQRMARIEGGQRGRFIDRLLKRSGKLSKLGKRGALVGAGLGAAAAAGAGLAATRRKRG